MQFYFVVLKMLSLKDTDSNSIIILYYKKGQWYGVDRIQCVVIINWNSTARKYKHHYKGKN